MTRPTDFTALDFETAHGGKNSICQVGLVRYVSDRIDREISLLIRPPDNFYWSSFIAIHGITPADTENSPTFSEAWDQISPFIEGLHVVAHNGFSFDFPVLEGTLAHYGRPLPKYSKHDTFRLHHRGLAELCRLYEIPLKHHDALSDARACGALFMLPPTPKRAARSYRRRF